MAEDRQLFTEELVSARYLTDAQANLEPEIECPARRAQPRRSGLEQAYRWISPLVAIMLIAAIGWWYWENQSSIKSGAGRFRQRTSNPVDFVMWLSGSEHTFEDVLIEAQRQSETQFDNAISPIEIKEFNFNQDDVANRFEHVWTPPGSP